MFLKDVKSGDLVEVVDVAEVTDPTTTEVTVRYQAGEERGDPVKMAKAGLVFPSDEKLPKCWLDAHYRMKF
jgi:hypothetical protein